MHNGVVLFPHVKETLNALKDQGKQVCFLSNSPRAGWHHEAFFKSLGVDPELYEFIFTSGDGLVAALDLCKGVKRNDPYFFIGDDMLHQPVIESMEGPRVETPEEATYILCTAPMMGYAHRLKESLPLKLPLICSNPDRVAIHGDQRIVCAGTVAHDYEKMGGDVFYCGKPEPFIYNALFKKLGLQDLSRVLAVGDGPFTDIKGANAMGIDSVLIDSNLHDEKTFTKALTHIHPTYGMREVCW